MNKAIGANKSTRDSLAIIALSIPTVPATPPAATACAISCKLKPAMIPNCKSENPSTGCNPISIKVNMVPKIATIATANTESLDFAFSGADTPITAAAPQILQPQAVSIAKVCSTLNKRHTR
ncbi:unknown [Dialister sp. CAG:588]|nr:unknown [Dialister sp. CAG:588]